MPLLEHSAILLTAFCNTFDLNQAIMGLENQLSVVFERTLKTGLIVIWSTPMDPKHSIIKELHCIIFVTHFNFFGFVISSSVCIPAVFFNSSSMLKSGQNR